MNKVLFQEEQCFNQWWLWLIIIGLFGTVIWPLVAFKTDIFSWTSIITIVFSLLMMLLFFILKLKTTITEEKISIHYYPFIKREWTWSELKTSNVIDYGFVGGWGITIWTGMGTVYNVRGSKGLHIKTDQKEYFIGTQKE
jgi:hypothetical protein